jgi:hypothetical protein
MASVPSRRTVLAGASGLAMALGTLALAGGRAVLPDRLPPDRPLPGRLLADETARPLPDIQFDIGGYIGPARTYDDGAGSVLAQMPPVHTVFVTATLNRAPDRADRAALADALAAIESAYPFAADGVLAFVSYGLPYFARLPASLVAEHMPRLAGSPARFALEEAVPGPTDVSPANPRIRKATFNIPVRIEQNDMLFTFRSDNAGNLSDVLAWLGGSGRLGGARLASPVLFRNLATVTSSRAHFIQFGLPRQVAARARLSYAGQINPGAPMWMGFLDQQVSGSGPAAICTFAGTTAARLTTARPGDYFDNGSVQHLSHVIEDLGQFYARKQEPYTERVQYLFRSNPIPSTRGSVYIDNVFRGTGDAAANARALGTFAHEHRLGHLSALQRSSRAPDGTAMHIRMDGPGFDGMDLPGGRSEPKLHFTIFVPTAEFFRLMRVNQASLDLAAKYGVPGNSNGIERFITTTRRQNFLVPPRRHRAFPLTELA